MRLNRCFGSMAAISIVATVVFSGGIQPALSAPRSGVPSAQLNLVQNRGFESPKVQGNNQFYAPYDLGGWMLSQGSLDLAADDYWQPAAGRQSIDLSGYLRGCNSRKIEGTIYQDIPTTPGTTYKVSFWLAGNPEGQPAIKRVRVVFGPVTQVFDFDTTGHSDMDMGWQKKGLRGVAADATTRLTFVSRTATCWGPALDRVSVKALSP